MNAEQLKSSLVKSLSKIETQEEKDYAIKLIQTYIERYNYPKELMLLRTRVPAGEPTYVSILRNDKNYSSYIFAHEILNFFLTDDYFTKMEFKLIEDDDDYLELWFDDKLFILIDATNFIITL